MNPNAEKLKVLLLYGGESTEHEVSIRSANSFYKAIDESRYQVFLCYIDRQGRWWLQKDWNSRDTDDQLELVVDYESGLLLGDVGGYKLRPELILPVLHGQFGEDGTIQDLAESMGIPIVGCDATASRRCWDKVETKRILESAGLATTPHVVCQSGETTPNYKQLQTRLSDVMFVKPARSGSSIGVSRVTSQPELDRAMKMAFEHDDKVLIEKAIVGRELEVGVLGNPPHHQVTGVGEIRPGEEFYSYDDKYDSQSSAEVIVEADLPETVRRSVQQIAHQAYWLLGCRGLSRVDFLLSEDGTAYVNEVNTFPGFTSISQYPKLWQAVGVSYSELIERLINDAMDRD